MMAQLGRNASQFCHIYVFEIKFSDFNLLMYN